MLFSILKNDGDNDEDDEEHDKPQQIMVKASAARALGMAWTRNAQLQGKIKK
jgi:proteasome component ECM29